MSRYACDPDCDERANCETENAPGHFQCGRCPECGEPRHHGCQIKCCTADLKGQR